MTLDKRHCPIARSNASQCSDELLSAPVGCKAKSSFLQRKAFCATLCASFDLKSPPSSNKTDTTAAMLISLAAANSYKLTAASSSSSSFVVLKPAAVVFSFFHHSQIRTMIGSLILRQAIKVLNTDGPDFRSSYNARL